MSRIKNPVNQKRHTNIAIVRLKKGGVKFELAAYPAKVAEWKNKVYVFPFTFVSVYIYM